MVRRDVVSWICEAQSHPHTSPQTQFCDLNR